VYSRILAKPNHGESLPQSNARLFPNLDLLTVCNEIVVDSDFKDLTDCDDMMLALGQITAGGTVLDPDGETLLRFDPDQKNKQGKQTGKSKAVDITGMFYWKGAVCPDTFDTDGDGKLEIEDFDVVGDGDGVKADDLDELIFLGVITAIGGEDGTALILAADMDANSMINTEAEFLALLELLEGCIVFDDFVWIFDIADLVIHGFDYENDGAKLVQIRFYDANAVNVQYVGDIDFLLPPP